MIEDISVLTNEVQVSILCATYNQESYIRQTLDSLLMQETNFKYEILVHDDASTDGTTDIVRDYASQYSNRIIPFIETENQFSKGVDFWREIAKKHKVAKYTAFCEGDDYWINTKKLQKQFDALELHQECDMCACRGVMVSEDGKQELGDIRPQKGNGILSMEDTILGGGMYLVTNSLFCRKSMGDNPMRFEMIRALDYATQIRGALRGGIYYIDEKMAAYRRFAKGSWTSVLVDKPEESALQCEQEKEILRTLDEETKGKYHGVITERLKAYETSFLGQLMDNREVLLQLLNECSGRVFMWGIGRRGIAFEEFCNNEGIKLSGVCDVTNNCVGNTTLYGNEIYHSDKVLDEASVILTSTTNAYEYLEGVGFTGKLFDLQKYMMIA